MVTDFNPNVGIVIRNRDDKYCGLSAMGSTPGSFRRVDDGESPEQAMYRELYEEIGLKQDDDHTGDQSQLAEVSFTQTTRPLGQFTGLY